MKIHLDEDIFEIVKNGKKDIEVRLNDEKRKKLKIGDKIIFLKRPLDDETITATITDLNYFNDFNSVIETYEMSRIYLPNETKEDYINLMKRFYTEEDTKKYG